MYGQENFYQSAKPNWRKRIVLTLATLTILAVAIWFFVGLWADAIHILRNGFVNHVWRGLFPNGWNILQAGPFFWILVVIAAYLSFYGTALTKLVSGEQVPNRGGTFRWATIAVGTSLCLLLVAPAFMHGVWNASHYNAATKYVIADMDSMPNSLTRIDASSRAQVDIVEGDMQNNWERRVASATGATYVMKKTGDSNANTVLMEETVTYIYNDEGGGSWTGIRNGKRRQPIFGVASWSGTGESVKTCQFKGDYELNKSFGGTWGINLSDDIAAFDVNFIYADEDVYGYCDGDQPIIVIPGARVTGLQVHTALQAYGVMTITGSPTGDPVIEFRTSVQPGDLPGPVYPVNLVEKQRKALEWSAGRVWPWQPPVGFEATSGNSQGGNNTDFLLKSKEDGRLYWVTPLKPRNTDSQTIVAYALVAADEITEGRLNDQLVYVLNDDDQNIVNFNDLENKVTQAVAKQDPGFFTGAEENRGNIVEFVPLGNGKWMVFAERGGRAVYQINVSGGSRLQTSVVSLENESEELLPETEQQNAGEGCNNPSQLTDTEIATCIKNLSEELIDRGVED